VRYSARPAVCLLAISTLSVQSQQHNFGVKDSIEMTTFSNPSALERDAQAIVSPDGKYLIVVTTRGLLKSNQVESTLWLWRRTKIEQFVNDRNSSSPPTPRKLVSVAAVPNFHPDRPYAPIITGVRWSLNSHEIYFLSYESEGNGRLNRVSVTGNIEHLTRSGYNVRQFNVLGKTIVYTVSHHDLHDVGCQLYSTPPLRASVMIGTGTPLNTLIFPDKRGDTYSELWTIQSGRSHRVLSGSCKTRNDADYYGSVLSISPEGHFIVALLPAESVPSLWDRYIPARGFEERRITSKSEDLLSPQNPFRPKQYTLINLASGHITRLIDAPVATPLAYQDRVQAVWSHDGQRLLLTNTFLPLDDSAETLNEKQARPCTAASFDLSTRAVRCIVTSRDNPIETTNNSAPLRLQEAAFGESGEDVSLRFSYHGERSELESYQFVQSEWRLQNTSGLEEIKRSLGLQVTVKQTLNDRPVLWATDAVSGESKKLWDPNPQFDALKFGDASVFHWKDGSGYEWTGGLVKPVGYIAGKRYPLIIQTHGFVPYQFITDGQFPTAMAARPLASVGFVVLQVYDRWDHVDQAQEAADQVAGYEAAIARLASENLVDPERVGIIGFSRTCWYVEDALIRNPELFAAATIADGVDYSYMQYFQFGEGHAFFQRDFEKVNGAEPIGIGLSRWLQRAPGFNLDKVQAPIRVEAIGASALLSEWEIYASLRKQHKPVDLVYIPHGQHILQAPQERYASQQGNVDWFRFWLAGYEDPDPSKVAQYIRWRGFGEKIRKK
jgi:dipeptidyl aminopeptidase/acylaminoacyl peptidase